MSEIYTGGDVIVTALKAAGVDTVFGIISIHNIPIYDAIARQGGIRVITNRSEPGAVNMADGYARATGRLGVAITSTGAGAGNAAGAITEAQTAGSHVLHLTGQIDSAHLDQGKGFIHECKDQFGMLKAISKEAYRVRSVQNLGSTIQQAIEMAMAAPTGVVSLEMPIDLQKAAQTPREFRFPEPARLSPDPVAIEKAAAILKTAKRPLIWAGNGVIQAGAHLDLTALAESWGAGVLTSQAGRGAISEDHSQCIGNFGNNAAVREYLQSCDVLLAVGTRFRGPETLGWKLPLPTTIVQVDTDPLAISRSYPATVGVVADAKLGLQALLAALKGQLDPHPAYLEDVGQARKAGRTALRATLGPYEQICDDLRASLDKDAIFVRDITISHSTWGSRLFPVYAPRQSIHAAGGGIGQGFQMALGVKLGQPEKQVVCIAGDGGFQVNIGELATARQENIPVVTILFNDKSYGVLRNIQNNQYEGRHIGIDLINPDFGKLAAAYGLNHYPVASVEAFKPAVAAALASGQPCIVEVDMIAVGPFKVPFGGPAAG